MVSVALGVQRMVPSSGPTASKSSFIALAQTAFHCCATKLGTCRVQLRSDQGLKGGRRLRGDDPSHLHEPYLAARLLRVQSTG